MIEHIITKYSKFSNRKLVYNREERTVCIYSMPYNFFIDKIHILDVVDILNTITDEDVFGE